MESMTHELVTGRARVVHLSIIGLHDSAGRASLERKLNNTEGVLSAEVSTGHAFVIYDPVKMCHHDLVEAIELTGDSQGPYRASVIYVMPLSAALRQPYSSGGVRPHA